ncbi:MAG TPA: cellulose synthase family protein [Anaerolineales bacterium]|nr:cellulose synthase family protein [Anaerolineales bacterium]
MQILIDSIGILYLLVIVGLSLYGLNSFLTAILYLLSNSQAKKRKKLPILKEWPAVTIQLPIFNEKYTVERLLRAVTELEYPSERLQIQVLDDSTDDTAHLVKNLVEEYKLDGLNIEWINRIDRKGYKAGALSEALKSATGELIAIFDADFVPRSDWLKKTVPLFQNRKLGCLQTRWGHTNRTYNSLTRAEALAIDGHFIIEQTARSKHDLFLNFNGTAGIWRRACIEDAGGWQWDTLTEDLDLSYRAQMRGWKIDYLPDVVVPAELPAQVEAFKKQQFRWAMGSSQVVRKILPKVFESGLPWRIRLMAVLHLTGYFVHPLMLASLLLTLPAGLLFPKGFTFFPISIIAGLGPPLLYLLARAPDSPPLHERLTLLPLLTLTGFGISLNTSIAVVQGLVKKGGAFIRTPKLNLGNRSKQRKDIENRYLPPISAVVWAEIGLGIYAFITGIVLQDSVGWGVVPWMILYTLGYFYIAGLNLLQHTPVRSARPTKSLTAHSAD